MRRIAPVVLAIAVLAAAGAASAQPAHTLPEAIDAGNATCLTREGLAPHVATWVGRDSIDGRIAITVRETPEGSTFVIRRDGSAIGERTLHLGAVSCSDRLAAVGLAIAVALDATLLETFGIAPAAKPPPPALPPWLPDAEPPRPPPPPPPAPRPIAKKPENVVRVDAEIDGDALVAVLPVVALAASPAFDISFYELFGVRVGGLATTPVSVPLAGGQAQTSLAAARVDLCLGRTISVLRTRGCLGVAGGPVATAGIGFSRSLADNAPLVDGILRVETRWLITPAFGVNLGVEGYLPAERPQLQVVGPTNAIVARDTLPPAGIGVLLGPSYRIW